MHHVDNSNAYLSRFLIDMHAFAVSEVSKICINIAFQMVKCFLDVKNIDWPKMRFLHDAVLTIANAERKLSVFLFPHLHRSQKMSYLEKLETGYVNSLYA